MITKSFVGSAFLLLVLMWMGLASAEIYKWVDKDGNVTFSEKKPPDPTTEVETIKQRRNRFATTEESAEELDEEDRTAVAREKAFKEEQEKQALAEANETIRRNNCANATQRYVSLQRPRVNEVAEDGTRTVLGEEVRQAEIAKSQKLMDEWCE